MHAPWTIANIPDQSGRIVVVTGANSGLGLETARILAIRKAHVILACRNLSKGEKAAGEIRATFAEAELDVRELDLANLASVKDFANGLTADYEHIDLLINNAGLMAVDKGKTVDGFEIQFGVNHLGHFALTGHLLPALTATPSSRVVTVSSMGHRIGRLLPNDLMFERRGYHRWQAYTQSKLANLLFTLELQHRLALTGAPTIALAAHPGLSRTDLGYEGNSFANRLVPIFTAPITQPAAMGALPTIRAATDPSALGGQFYGPRFKMRGMPVLETPSNTARDGAMARKLWQISEQLVDMQVLTPAE